MGRQGVAIVLVVLIGSCAPMAQDRKGDLTRDGLDLYRREAFVDARDTFRAALALSPEDAELHYLLARCSDRMGQAVEAEKGYVECLRRNAQHAEARHALAVLLVKRGRRGEAEKMAEDWLRTAPRLAGPYALDGYLRAETGDWISARSRFQQALSFDPFHVPALVELARVYERLEYPDRALLLYERALEVRPEQAEVRQRVAALRKRGIVAPRPD